MAFEPVRISLADHPLIHGCFEKHGFQRSVPSRFSHGRADVRFEGVRLIAEPIDGSRTWLSDVGQTPPEAVVELLNVVLAMPPFLSQKELDRRVERTHDAKIALDRVVEVVREAPETHCGRELRRFLWSLFNQHHVVNLWNLKDVLDSRGSSWVTEVFTAWMQGCVSEEVLRRALTDSGEMDRWDTFSFQRRDADLLTDALNAGTCPLPSTGRSSNWKALPSANRSEPNSTCESSRTSSESPLNTIRSFASRAVG